MSVFYEEKRPHSDEDYRDCQPLDLSVQKCQEKDNATKLWLSLSEFAAEFKCRRIKLGRTQTDVGHDLLHILGHDFSQTTISRFEALNLSLTNMLKLRPILQSWLDGDVDGQPKSLITSIRRRRRRRRRTSLSLATRTALEAVFAVNANPGADDLAKIAREVGLDREVARVWFCNRRVYIKKVF